MQTNLTEEKILVDAVLQVPQDSQQEAETIKIASRFGEIFVRADKAVHFPHGIPGVPGFTNFCITDLPNIKNPQFKLLQCLDDHSLSFIIIPSSYDNQLLEISDMDDACAVLGVNKSNLLLLFIVTVHETLEGRKISINAKAPVFVDVANKVAVQYVFQNNNYQIQHFIS